ncbi:MAG: DUF1565 domain-containing protein [Caldithrix sp.]|nr:DUF1565 domain-containing protein [Caldithrix sp.]
MSFYNSTTGSVSNSTIQNNTYGVYIYKALPEIENCTIANNSSRGIYLYRTNDIQGDRTQIIGNEICNSNYDGIYLYKSSPDIRNNVIYDHQCGISGFNNSSPWLGNLNFLGYNNIYDNSYSNLEFVVDCNPDLGQSSCTTHGGHNQITGDAYHVWAETDCYVMAQVNYWYPYTDVRFSAHDGSTINREYPLPSPVFGSRLAGGSSPEESAFDSDFSNATEEPVTNLMDYYKPEWPILNKLIFARNLIYLGGNEDAQSICKEVIENNPDSTLSFFALDILWESSRHEQAKPGYDLKAFESYLQELSNKKEKKELYGYSELLSASYNEDKAITTADKVYSEYEDTFLQESALLQNFMYYYHELNDLKMAEQIYNQMKSEFPNSTSTRKAREHMEFSNASLAKNSMNASPAKQISGLLPFEYSISSNYPNPFNPSTTIEYTLPKTSRIKTVIYNLVGQKVKTYSDLDKHSGIHSLTWDGHNDSGMDVPSGLYILHFYAESLDDEDNKSVFTKSIKMLLLR